MRDEYAIVLLLTDYAAGLWRKVVRAVQSVQVTRVHRIISQ